MPLFRIGLTPYSGFTMNKDLRSLDFSNLDLEPEIQQILSQLLNHTEVLTTELEKVKKENQDLRDEIARLKGGKGKPKIKPNKTDDDNEEDEDKQSKKKKRRPRTNKKPKNSEPRKKRIKIDREETIEVDRSELPDDAKVVGYREVTIQNIKFETDNVLYRLEKLYSESTGKYYEADMPKECAGQSFGSGIEAFILLLYFQLRVTQNKIHKLLTSIGNVISEGQISNVISKKHLDKFEKEREEIVRAGLESSSYQQTDDTGARENGVNHHTIFLGNKNYSSYFTERYKNQETMKNLLNFLEEPSENEGVSKEFGDYVKILIADDAPQFHNITEFRGLCWWHETRLFEKLHPVFDYHQKILDGFIGKVWDYYEELENYKKKPSEKFKEELSVEFDSLFSTVTGYDKLDHRIKLTSKKKPYLLLVLDYPEIPLDNNLSERGLRKVVIKRKISNGTRVKDGTKSWDVFLSILETCEKNYVNFYEYLQDRISSAYMMPSLASILLERRQTATVPTIF